LCLPGGGDRLRHLPRILRSLNMEKPGWLGKSLGGIVAIAIIAGAVTLGWEYLRTSEENPASEDAVVQANLLNGSSTVPGRIIEIAFTEGQEVKLCCKKCKTSFDKDPAKFIKQIQDAK
ncbi:MAG: hypothetical protein J0I10_00990, partial [Verrucomicrobia bacterium]|nr:hypothetical protein [Verrucomicrobiota bacterium]